MLFKSTVQNDAKSSKYFHLHESDLTKLPKIEPYSSEKNFQWKIDHWESKMVTSN